MPIFCPKNETVHKHEYNTYSYHSNIIKLQTRLCGYDWMKRPINQNKKSRNNRTQSSFIRLIGMVFSNSAKLSESDRYDSANKRTKETSELMKLHIQGVWQLADTDIFHDDY